MVDARQSLRWAIRKRLFPWLTAVTLVFLGAAPVVIHQQADLEIAGLAMFAFMAALILHHQPHNRLGWLMMLVAFAGGDPFLFLILFVPAPPAVVSPGLWLLLWAQNQMFFLSVITLCLIFLHFPNGRPPSRRWHWVNIVALFILLLQATFPLFTNPIGPIGGWVADNPYGFIPAAVQDIIFLFFGLGLFAVIGGSLVALIHRFRRAVSVEREQMKWLLLTAGMFATVFIIRLATYQGPWDDVTGILLTMAIMAIPVAIAIAILRYRLYDIDLIIRRTLQYTLLTGLLALVYFGGVVLLQRILGPLTGQANSPLIIVITTLLIAGLFNPLRRRVQDFIDRRFYRQKYDAQRALTRFAAAARDEVDKDRLAAELVGVVHETIQPEQVSLWLRDMPGE